MPTPDPLYPEPDSGSNDPAPARASAATADGNSEQSESIVERTLDAWGVTHEDAQVALMALNVLAFLYLIHITKNE